MTQRIMLKTNKEITSQFQRDSSILEQFIKNVNIKYDSKLQLTHNFLETETKEILKYLD